MSLPELQIISFVVMVAFAFAGVTYIFLCAHRIARKIEKMLPTGGIFSQLIQYSWLRRPEINQVIDADPELTARMNKLERDKYIFIVLNGLLLLALFLIGLPAN